MSEYDSERVIVIHYHEIALKKKNRAKFENQLLLNIKRGLSGLPYRQLKRVYGRIFIQTQPDTPLDQVRERLRYIFGIAYFAEAAMTAIELDEMKRCAWEMMRNHRFDSFRINARRARKDLPFTSMDVNAEVGRFIQERSGAAVNLSDPALTCHIEIADRQTFVYTEKFKGPGGLPVGVSEKAISLISSGIDSPVASYKMLKRGVRLIFVHFHSHPYTNRASQVKTEQLVQVLTRHQFNSKLYLVPFIEIQKKIMQTVPAPPRVLLYRRCMIRIAESIAHREGATALVTGESVGQVASQTLTNIGVISEATSLPVVRPLAGDDKEEIVKLAQQIGTYEISIEPYEDCCSVFIPRHPETKANLEKIKSIESTLELDPLVESTIEAIELKQVTCD